MASATASELSIGAGAAYNESPYRGYNENTKAIPLISYEGDSFYVRQTTLGFILSQSEKNELSLTASWMPLEFDPADNDDYAMQQLDKRDSTAMAGLPGITTSVGGTVKALQLRTFWITATAGWGAIGIPQNADRSSVADTCAGRSLL